MTPEREMIVWAVLEGKLPEQMLTQEEVDEVLEGRGFALGYAATVSTTWIHSRGFSILTVGMMA